MIEPITDLASFLGAHRVFVTRNRVTELAAWCAWCHERLGDPIWSYDMAVYERDGKVGTNVDYASRDRNSWRFDRSKKWGYAGDIWGGYHFFFASLTDAIEFKLLWGC